MKKYRLNNYIITEYKEDIFSYETHIALGSQLSGNCFIIGDILVLEPCEHEDSGFLILEFHEHLLKLKAWDKTRYYCSSLTLWDVKSGQNLSKYFIKRSSHVIAPVNVNNPGVFRLGKYQIVFEQNENMSWHTYESLNKIISGKCIIESGILFIGNRESERYDSQKKKVWFKTIKSLPKWDKTFAWGHLKVLHDCRHEEFKKRTIWKHEKIDNRIKSKYQLSSRERDLQNEETASFPKLENAWRRFFEWEGWRDFVLPFLIKILSAFFFVLWFIFVKAFKWLGKMVKGKMNKFIELLIFLSFALIAPAGSITMVGADNNGVDRQSHEMYFDHDDKHKEKRGEKE